ncbi:ComEC family competence protein, partial [bacterium]|nr:ComEC family competence protein [bacterium]
MNQFIVSGAAGFVVGIISARICNTGINQIHVSLVAGLVLLAISLILLTARKTVWPITFIALVCLGFANTNWHQDISTPGHLHQIMKASDYDEKLVLEGTVIHPPDIRERYTILPMKILRLVGTNGLPITVKRGHVYVKIYPSVGDIISKVAYGDHLELKNVVLRIPSAAANPGSFNMQKFLYNQGYFAQINVREPNQIHIKNHGSGNPIIKAAEVVKKKLLITIKQTLPFPESSFLGGVLLGLRSGLSTEIKDTFRAAGVSHVLAVSGLHVTIITLFFMGMFNLLRVPRTTTFVMIISALILFTLITGARPSTIRAAIMNSVTLLFFYYRGIKLDRSFLLGVSVAALFILIRNPMLLTEASFLFSFSAVLSLA